MKLRKQNASGLIGRCFLAGAFALGSINIGGCVANDPGVDWGAPNNRDKKYVDGHLNPRFKKYPDAGVDWGAPNNRDKKYVDGHLNPRFKKEKKQNYRPIEEEIGAAVIINELYNPKIFKR